MSGYDALPHDAWPDIAAVLPLPWHPAAAAHDLRWHAAEHHVYGRKLPGIRDLAERWGWARSVAHRLVASATWTDEARPWGWRAVNISGTDAGQTRDTSNGETPMIDESRDARGTAAGLTRDPFPHPTPIHDQSGGEMRTAEAAAEPMDLPALLNGDPTLLAPLLAAEIATVAGLAAQTQSAIRMLPGIGPKRAIALHQALQRHGLAFRAEPMPKGKRETDRPGLRDLQDRWCGAFRYVTGKDYAWTPRGRTSDGKAAADVYDAMGWSAEPTPETVAAVKATVGRYLRHCQQANPPRVATLHDLARNLSSYRQDDALVDATRARVRVDAAAQREDAKMTLIGNLLNRQPKENIDA